MTDKECMARLTRADELMMSSPDDKYDDLYGHYEDLCNDHLENIQYMYKHVEALFKANNALFLFDLNFDWS